MTTVGVWQLRCIALLSLRLARRNTSLVRRDRSYHAEMLGIIDAGEACYARATKVDDTSMAHVVDVRSRPASMVQLPQMVGRLMVATNCTTIQKCLKGATAYNVSSQGPHCQEVFWLTSCWPQHCIGCANDAAQSRRECRVRTEEGGIRGDFLPCIVPIEGFQVPILRRAGQAFQIIQIAHSLDILHQCL